MAAACSGRGGALREFGGNWQSRLSKTGTMSTKSRPVVGTGRPSKNASSSTDFQILSAAALIRTTSPRFRFEPAVASEPMEQWRRNS